MVDALCQQRKPLDMMSRSEGNDEKLFIVLVVCSTIKQHKIDKEVRSARGNYTKNDCFCSKDKQVNNGCVRENVVNVLGKPKAEGTSVKAREDDFTGASRSKCRCV